MCNLSLPPGVKELKVVLGIFKEQSYEIRSILPAVFFENTVWMFSENSLKNICDRVHIQRICKPSSWQIYSQTG